MPDWFKHRYIGSNIDEPSVVNEIPRRLFELVRSINVETGLMLRKIDLGGGLGFPYEPDSHCMSCGEYASAIFANNLSLLKELRNPKLIFEPGRAIVADSGILLTRVGAVEKQGEVDWAIVDAGMNVLIRPALYGAKHQILLVNQRSGTHTRYRIGGPCCESGDILANNVALPTLRECDLLAVLDVGAYGFTMSSNYNGYERPAVVLVAHGEGELIRRRESYEDMIVNEIIPANLLSSDC
jgi:diaminopimelate decarboxylase